MKNEKKLWQHRNPERYGAWKVEWRKKTLEKKKEQMKAWRQANPEKTRMNNALRRARKRNAVPSWLSPGMKEAILQKYETAQKLTESTGIAYQVDHIIPLAGKDVSGLHVPWNLQVITATENLKKSNSSF